MIASAAFKIIAWDEAVSHDLEGARKLTHAQIEKTFHGDIEGEGRLEYLLAYTAEDSAEFVGMEHIQGRIGARAGSFVLEHRGTFEAGVSTVALQVVPGTATGELEGLRGEGSFSSGHAEEYPFTLDLNFG
jgi:hypothetical protein